MSWPYSEVTVRNSDKWGKGDILKLKISLVCNGHPDERGDELIWTDAISRRKFYSPSCCKRMLPLCSRRDTERHLRLKPCGDMKGLREHWIKGDVLFRQVSIKCIGISKKYSGILTWKETLKSAIYMSTGCCKAIPPSYIRKKKKSLLTHIKTKACAKKVKYQNIAEKDIPRPTHSAFLPFWMSAASAFHKESTLFNFDGWKKHFFKTSQLTHPDNGTRAKLAELPLSVWRKEKSRTGWSAYNTTDCISPFYELNETLNMDDLGTIRQVKIEKPDIDDGTELDEESCVGTITSERKLGGKFYWFCNDRLTEMLGFDNPEEIFATQTHPLSTLYWCDWAPRIRAWCDEIRLGVGDHTWFARKVRKDGSIQKFVLISKYTCHDEGRKAVHYHFPVA